MSTTYPHHHRRLKKSFKIAIGLVCALLVIGAATAAYFLWHNANPALKDTPGYGVEIPDWITQDLLPINEYSRPGEPLPEVNGIVIHYVGNPGTSAKANRDYFANLAVTHETSVSSHFLVGLEGEIIQCVPISEISYCSNNRNYDTIAIEVCHDDETGEFSQQTLESVERLTAWLCATFDLSTEQVIRHYDVTGKICPKYYVEHEDAWSDLLAGVAKEIPSFAQDSGE